MYSFSIYMLPYLILFTLLLFTNKKNVYIDIICYTHIKKMLFGVTMVLLGEENYYYYYMYTRTKKNQKTY
jgi:hypothetical protein